MFAKFNKKYEIIYALYIRCGLIKYFSDLRVSHNLLSPSENI